MDKDTIQVLVCTYQGEQFIVEQLDSIEAQTYSNIEVHIFDDCSADDTLVIVKDYCEKRQNFFWHKNSKNIGFLKNFENAINSVSGDYIALCDQDDIWLPDKLEQSMKAMKEIEEQFPMTPALVHCDLTLVDSFGKPLSPSFFERKKISLSVKKSLNSIIGHCGVMGNTILMNRLLVKKALPFPDGLKYHDYWLALVNELFGIRKTISQTLVKYRIHSSNTSNNNNILNQANLKTEFRNYALPFKEDKREFPIRFLITTYKLDKDDEVIVRKFYDYLLSKGSRLSQFYFLIRYDLLKDDLKYRLSVFFRVMLTKRY